MAGARLLVRAGTVNLRILFAVVIALLGLQMMFKGLWGKF